ncbi:MAG: tetratricopeptide repeat protein [Nitrospinae bacterium]|nr:tetratricopeptide repeat protein [Nitrospinota bacterium]
MRESQIQIITFAFAATLLLAGIVLVWTGHAGFAALFAIFIPAFILVLAGILGPSRIKDLLGKRPAPAPGPQGGERHYASELERNLCLIIADDFPPPSLTKDGQSYARAAENRSDEQRSPGDYLILATLAWRSKQFEHALKYVFSGLNLEPGDRRVKAYLRHRLGTILQTMPVEETAVRCYHEAIKLNPQFSWPHNSLGLTFRYHKNFAEADKEFQEAIRLYPENTRPYYNLAVSYFMQKRFPDAEKKFREILQMDPQCYRAHNRLGMIHLEQGRTDKAEEAFREALKIEPGYAKAQKNLLPLLQEKEKKAEEQKQRELEREKAREKEIQREKERAKEKEKEKKK